MTARFRPPFSLLARLTLPAAALLLASTARRAASDAAAPKKTLHIALVTNNASDYWEVANYGAQQTARKANVELLFKVPAPGTAAEQNQIVDDLLAEGVDGIAVSPVDGPNQGDILNRAARKTLLFTFDSDAPQSKRACYVGTDNIRAGRQAGAEVKRALPHGGSIMVFVGKIDALNARDRYAGLRQALRGSRVHILGVRTDNTERARAKSNVTEALKQHPHIRGMVGLWSYNGPAILSAVKDAHRLKRVKIIAFDEDDDTLDGVESGAISASIVQQPFRLGEVTVRVMAQVLAGNRHAIPASKKIIVPTLTIRRGNVAAFRAGLKKMRGR